MKTFLKITMGLFISSVALIACNKDDDLSTQQKLQNLWKVDSVSLKTVTAASTSTITQPGVAEDYYDFRSDGKLYSQFHGSKDTVEYTLINDNAIAVNNNGSRDTGRITTLTNTKLVGVTKFVVNSTDYNEISLYLRR